MEYFYKEKMIHVLKDYLTTFLVEEINISEIGEKQINKGSVITMPSVAINWISQDILAANHCFNNRTMTRTYRASFCF